MRTKIKKYLNKLENEHLSFVLKGGVYSFVAKTSAFIIGFLISYIIATYFSEEAVGVVSLILNSVMILSTLMLLGTDSSVLRLFPEYTLKNNYSLYLIYKKIIFVLLGSSFLIIVVVLFFQDSISTYLYKSISIEYIVYFILFFSFFKALEKLNLSLFRALKDIKYFAFFQVIVPFFILISLLIIIMYLISLNINIPIYIYFFITAIFTVITCFIIKNKLVNKGDLNISYKKIIKVSFPMMLSSILLILLATVDTFIIEYFKGIRSVGIYAIATKIATLVIFFNTVLNVIVSPKISELYYNNKQKELEYLLKKITTINFFIIIPIVLILIIIGDILLSVFGNEYLSGYTALVFLLIAQLINAASGPTGNFMNMTGNETTFVIILIIALLINITLNIFLIPEYDISGAAFATLISMGFWNISIIIFIKINQGYYITPRLMVFIEIINKLYKGNK